jgi:hypothetical protein
MGERGLIIMLEEITTITCATFFVVVVIKQAINRYRNAREDKE